MLINRDGVNLDAPMAQAISRILKSVEGQGIECAVLKSRSPTCGVRQVYDGTFSGKLVSGMGLFAKALSEQGIRVLDGTPVFANTLLKYINLLAAGAELSVAYSHDIPYDKTIIDFLLHSHIINLQDL